MMMALALVCGGGAIALKIESRRIAEWLYLGTEVRTVNLRDGAMYQRGDASPVTIHVSGRVELLASKVQAGVTQAGGVVREEDWRTLDSRPALVFAGPLELQAGWHKVFLRSVGPTGQRVQDPVRIGVGEIFIVAGQSNASGSSRTLFAPNSTFTRTADLAETGEILDWRIAADPQVRNGGGSVWPLVGDHLAEALGVPIGFVNVAVGSSSIDDWQPGEEAFARLASVVEQLGPRGFRAILWHQGETDRAMSEEEYARKLDAAIVGLNRRLQRGVPWVVAQASFAGDGPSAPVRAAQGRSWREGFAFPGPDTDQLGREFREDADEVHFNEAGTRAAADLWVKSILTSLFEHEPLLARDSR